MKAPRKKNLGKQKTCSGRMILLPLKRKEQENCLHMF